MKNYKHSKIITEISKKLGIDGAVVNIVVVHFFNSVRQALQKNEEINLKGFFKIKMLKRYKNKIHKEGNDINLRKRKHQKRYK
jgi:nucleoid DNA-binding protein